MSMTLENRVFLFGKHLLAADSGDGGIYVEGFGDLLLGCGPEGFFECRAEPGLLGEKGDEPADKGSRQEQSSDCTVGLPFPPLPIVFWRRGGDRGNVGVAAHEALGTLGSRVCGGQRGRLSARQ